MGKKIVTACIAMMPGASLAKGFVSMSHRDGIVFRITYHIGGTQNLLTGLNALEKTDANHNGVPGSLSSGQRGNRGGQCIAYPAMTHIVV